MKSESIEQVRKDFVNLFSTYSTMLRQKIYIKMKQFPPDPLIIPFVEQLKEKLWDKESLFLEKLKLYKPISADIWKLKCSQYFHQFESHKISLFDVTINEELNMKDIFVFLSCGMRKFCLKSHLDTFVNHLERLLKVEKLYSEEMHKLVEEVANFESREKCNLLFKEAAKNLSDLNLNEEKTIFFGVSLFLSMSGLFQPLEKSTFLNGRSCPVLREAMRQSIKHFRKLHPNSPIASIIDLKKFNEFEGVLGIHVAASSPATLELHQLDYCKYLKERDPSEMEKIVGATNFKYIKDVLQMMVLENMAPERKSPDVLICFSGFLSEKAKLSKKWGQVIAMNPNQSVYTVRWASKTKLHLLRAVKNYKEACIQAKAVGSALALALASRYPFPNESVSLTGFSLGTKAVSQCIKVLHRIQQTNIISNVYFFGGAAGLGGEKIGIWQERLSIVSGRVVSCYTHKDWVLKMLKRVLGKNPIGLRPISITPDPSSKSILITNSKTEIESYDVSGIVRGHLNYTKSYKAISHFIQFD